MLSATFDQARNRIAAADAAALPALVANAQRLLPDHAEAIRTAYLSRLAEIHGSASPDFEQAVRASIVVFRAEQGRTVNWASGNRRHVEFQIRQPGGSVAAMAKLVTGPASSGFSLLIERGLAALTAEGLVVRFPHLFEADVRERARARLAAVGVCFPGGGDVR